MQGWSRLAALDIRLELPFWVSQATDNSAAGVAGSAQPPPTLADAAAHLGHTQLTAPRGAGDCACFWRVRCEPRGSQTNRVVLAQREILSYTRGARMGVREGRPDPGLPVPMGGLEQSTELGAAHHVQTERLSDSAVGLPPSSLGRAHGAAIPSQAALCDVEALPPSPPCSPDRLPGCAFGQPPSGSHISRSRACARVRAAQRFEACWGKQRPRIACPCFTLSEAVTGRPVGRTCGEGPPGVSVTHGTAHFGIGR